MKFEDLLEEIITELGYRVDSGVPDLQNKEHISTLSEILSDFGLSNIKHDIIDNLIREESEEEEERNSKKFNHPILNKEIEYEDNDGNEKSGLVGNLIRQPENTPARDAAEAALPEEGSEEREEINKELGDEGDGAGTEAPQPNDGDDEVESGESEEEKKRKTKAMYSTPDQQAILDKEKEVLDRESGESDDKDQIEFPETKKPQKGQVSDLDDEFSDGDQKQKAFENGFSEGDGFKPAPGNAASMLYEIMSGESYAHLDENPDMDESELAERLYEQVSETKLGDDTSSGGDYKTGDQKGKNKKLWKRCETIAKAGKVKYNRTQSGVDSLQSEGLIGDEVHTRNYYGTDVSIQKQISLVKSLEGPFYTRKGVDVPKDELIELIRKSGGGENPSDTATITTDKQGRAMVEFHSDKYTSADIQANSTTRKESEDAVSILNESELNISGQVKEISTQIIQQGQQRLESKESELKTAASEPARQMAEMDIGKILDDIKSDKGITGRDKVSTKLKTLRSRGNPHPAIRDYLPEQDGEYSDEQLLKAFYEFNADDDNDREPTANQLKLLYRSAAQQGFDISKKLGQIREESIEIQRDVHSKLNERSVTLPNGDSKPLGDYIEGKNIIDKFHIGVIDGENGKGVSKYDGLFNVNMGGTLITSDILKKSLNVEDTSDFITHLDVGSPEGGDEVTRNRDGEVTGRNVFIYAVTKKGKRIKVGFKTQRSKQGQSGKLDTTYQWDKQMRSMFENNQPDNL